MVPKGPLIKDVGNLERGVCKVTLKVPTTGRGCQKKYRSLLWMVPNMLILGIPYFVVLSKNIGNCKMPTPFSLNKCYLGSSLFGLE